MKKPVLCSVCLMSLGSVCEVMAQPVATDFRSPVSPVDQSGTNKNGYYDANPFLANTPGRGHHTGEDWNGNKEGKGSTDYGDPVYPTAVGKVVKVFDPPLTQKHSWGKTVIIKHILPDGRIIFSLYAHLSKTFVSVGQTVYPNKPLGNIGDANGYYAGAAHLHFEMRWVNDWTPTSPGYYKALTIANALKYLDPSLFIDNRGSGDVGIGDLAGNTFSSSDRNIQVSDYAPVSLAFVTHDEKTLSLPLAIEAGWIDPTVRVRDHATNRWTATTLSNFVFNPNVDFKIKFLQDCFLMIVVPGHNFQASRARGDMIKAADRAGFTRVKLETLTDLGDDGTLAFDLRSLCFDDGPNTGVGCLVQATNHDNPLLRYVIWYDPATNMGIGDWIALDQNDLD